ncbi:MAG: hypothetical protein ACXVFN_00110 [Solirubrobacteraceae bacterium]
MVLPATLGVRDAQALHAGRIELALASDREPGQRAPTQLGEFVVVDPQVGCLVYALPSCLVAVLPAARLSEQPQSPVGALGVRDATRIMDEGACLDRPFEAEAAGELAQRGLADARSPQPIDV